MIEALFENSDARPQRLLLAVQGEATRIEELSWRFQQAGAAEPQWERLFLVFQIALGIVTVAGLIAGVVYFLRHRASHHPHSLWREICSAHGFSAGQKRLLKKLTMKLGNTHPCTLAIIPELFEKVANEKTLTTSEAAQLETIRAKLFGSLKATVVGPNPKATDA